LEQLSGSGSYFDNFSLNVGTFAYDDFNDSIIDNKIWIQLGSFPERYVVETNDRLELRADGSEDDSGGLRTKFLLPIAEDFRAEVFFNSSECTSNSGMLLMVNNANDPDEPPGEYVYIANGAIDGKRVWIAGKAVWHEGLVYEKTEETAVDSGRLFITNHGGIFHLSYEGYGAQNAFATVNIEGWMDCTQISITIGGWTAYEALSGKGSYLDNFLLTGSEVVCTQRPAMDFNDDCKVDFKDLAIFMQSWLECNLVPPEACWQ
jgi:hypothetical protein